VRETVEKTHEQAKRMQAPRALALCLCFGGALEFQTGEWGRAESDLRQAIELYRQVGSASGEALSLQRLGVLTTAKGNPEEGREHLLDGIVVAERAAMRAHCLTRLHASMLRNRLAAGDLDGATSSLADGMEAARRHGHCVTCNALLAPEIVRAQIALGRPELAEESAATLERTAQEFQSRAWLAMAAHARARVARARGEHQKALEGLETAAETYLEIDHTYDAARCLAGQASLLRDIPGADPDKAEILERRAREMFGSLGAPGIED